MADTGVTEEQPEDAPAPPVPWYSLNPRTLRRSKLARALLIGLVLASFNIAPLWRGLWYGHIYPFRDFLPVRNAHGRWVPAWRWAVGKEIRVYQVPGVAPGAAEEIAEGARALVDDAGLDFRVRVSPIPKPVLEAYLDSLTPRQVNGRQQLCVNFARLESQLIELRQDDPHADMLVVDAPIAGFAWAHGMAIFNSGVAVLCDGNVSTHLGKHETAHLLGYMIHDTFPLYVLGYPREGLPWSRDTLMVLYGRSDDLSPRARDALRCFWRGMEHRLHKPFLAAR